MNKTFIAGISLFLIWLLIIAVVFAVQYKKPNVKEKEELILHTDSLHMLAGTRQLLP